MSRKRSKLAHPTLVLSPAVIASIVGGIDHGSSAVTAVCAAIVCASVLVVHVLDGRHR